MLVFLSSLKAKGYKMIKVIQQASKVTTGSLDALRVGHCYKLIYAQGSSLKSGDILIVTESISQKFVTAINRNLTVSLSGFSNTDYQFEEIALDVTVGSVTPEKTVQEPVKPAETPTSVKTNTCRH